MSPSHLATQEQLFQNFITILQQLKGVKTIKTFSKETLSYGSQEKQLSAVILQGEKNMTKRKKGRYEEEKLKKNEVRSE